MTDEKKRMSPAMAVVQLVVLVGVFVVVWRVMSGDGDESEKADKPKAEKKETAPKLPYATRDEFLAATLAQFGPDGTGALFDKGTVLMDPSDDFEPDSVMIRYQIAEGKQLSRAEAETVLRPLAGAGVKALIERGWNPREKMTLVWARASQPAGGSVTGEPTVRRFGTARYDYNEDRILFDAK